MSGGIYTTDKSKTLESLADVDFNNLQNNQAPVYDDTLEIFTNKTILTSGSFPTGSSGDIIISDGAGGLDSTDKLNVNPANGEVTGTYLNVSSTDVKMANSAGLGAGSDTISIGWNSGLSAGLNAIAVGTIAGQNGGTNSVSLGFNAQANDNNCVVINGSGTLTQSAQSDSCYINPLRNLNATTLTDPYVVQYNDTTKEVIKSEDLQIRDIACRDILNSGTFDNTGTASLYNGQLTVGDTANRAIIGAPNTILSVDLQNRRVGINIENPTEDLDIDGNIQLNSASTSKIVFYDSNDAHEHAEIDATDDGLFGGQLQFHTKVDLLAVTEKLRINNIGAFGIGGANYGTSGQVLTSNGSGSAVSWEDPAGTTYTAGTNLTLVGTTFSTIASPTFDEIDGGVANVSIVYNESTPNPRLRFNGGSTTGIYFTMRNDEFNVYNGSNTAAGLYLNFNGGTVYYGNPATPLSDDRIKFNETNITNGLEIIRQLSPEKYTKRLPDQSVGIEEAGFIAQEVLNIPELAFTVKHPEKEYIEGDPNTRYYFVNYESIFTYAVAGLKELDTIVQQQAQLISSLEARLSALENN